jgi:hypothetical protein
MAFNQFPLEKDVLTACFEHNTQHADTNFIDAQRMQEVIDELQYLCVSFMRYRLYSYWVVNTAMCFTAYLLLWVMVKFTYSCCRAELSHLRYYSGEADGVLQDNSVKIQSSGTKIIDDKCYLVTKYRDVELLVEAPESFFTKAMVVDGYKPESLLDGSTMKEISKLPPGIFALTVDGKVHGCGFRSGEFVYTALHVLDTLRIQRELTGAPIQLMVNGKLYLMSDDWKYFDNTGCDVCIIRCPDSFYAGAGIASLKIRSPCRGDVVKLYGFDSKQPTMSVGAITGDIDIPSRTFVHTASTYPGWSGTPLIKTTDNSVVGIHTSGGKTNNIAVFPMFFRKAEFFFKPESADMRAELFPDDFFSGDKTEELEQQYQSVVDKSVDMFGPVKNTLQQPLKLTREERQRLLGVKMSKDRVYVPFEEAKKRLGDIFSTAPDPTQLPKIVAAPWADITDETKQYTQESAFQFQEVIPPTTKVASMSPSATPLPVVANPPLTDVKSVATPSQKRRQRKKASLSGKVASALPLAPGSLKPHSPVCVLETKEAISKLQENMMESYVIMTGLLQEQSKVVSTTKPPGGN